MTLTEFLDLLIPPGGFRFVQYGHKSPQQVRSAKTNQSLADIIEELDATGTQVWFAPAAFAERECVTSKGEVKQRCQENVLSLQALWLDIDAGKDKHAKGRGYLTQDDALAAIDDFCATYNLPTPLRVSSGYGIHCYWPFSKPIRPQSWVKLATILKAMTKAHGLLADPSRTADSSSLLRPITANNLKNPDFPRVVQVVGQSDGIYNPSEFAKLLLPHASAKPAATLGQAPKHASAAINDDLALPEGSYPDVDANTLADNCAQIRLFRDTGSDDYGHWFRAIGTVKHCVDGEQHCHQWSAKSQQYTERETQFKIDEWKTGPATCAAFEDHNGLCSGCRYFGKIASPIRLGFVQQTMVEIVDEDVVFAEGISEPVTTTIELPEPYSIDSNGRLCITVKKEIKPKKSDPPGTPSTWEEDTFPWCDLFFYPADRIEGEDGAMEQRIRFKVRGRWKELTIPTHLVAGGKDLHKALAKYEIVVKGAYKNILDDYVVSFTNKLRELKESIQSYRTFGWQADGSFVTGDKVFTKDGVRQVVLGGGNAAQFAKYLTAQGSAQEWAALVDHAYNHPNHEQYQFVIYAGFGSVLVKQLNMGSSVLSLYGGKGQGKTTVAKVALSAFGNPEKMSNTWDSGSTFKANIITASVLNSLPYLIDEFSNAEPKQLSLAAYTFANSKGRTVTNQHQQLVTGGADWSNTTIFTTNTSLHDVLASAKEDASAEISRIVEMQWHATSALSKNEMVELYPKIVENSGAAGEKFIEFVVSRQDECRAIVMAIMKRVDAAIGFTSEFRYWSQIISAALAAGFIATKLGLLKFDFAAVQDFGIALGKRQMAKLPATTSSPVDSFHTMLTAFAQRIVTTNSEVDRSGALYEVKVVGDPVGRVILDQGVGYVAIAAIREWCNKRCVGIERIREELQASGALLDADVKYYIGRGTKLSTGQMRCWRIDWTKINTHHVAPSSHLQLVKP